MTELEPISHLTLPQLVHLGKWPNNLLLLLMHNSWRLIITLSSLDYFQNYMHGWVPSLFTWTYHSIVNQLYPQYKVKSLKFEKKNLGKPLAEYLAPKRRLISTVSSSLPPCCWFVIYQGLELRGWHVWSHFCLQILLAQYVSVSHFLPESLLPQVSNTEGVAMATTILWLGVVIKPQEAKSVLSCRCPQNHRAGRVSLGRTLGYEILGLWWARVETKPVI